MLRVPKDKELCQQELAYIKSLWMNWNKRQVKTFGGFMIHSHWKVKLQFALTVFSSPPLLENIFLRRQAGIKCGWEPSVRWSCGACYKADVVKHSYCCAKWNERKSPGETLALNMNQTESPALSPRINHAQRCVNERNSRRNLKEQLPPVLNSARLWKRKLLI